MKRRICKIAAIALTTALCLGALPDAMMPDVAVAAESTKESADQELSEYDANEGAAVQSDDNISEPEMTSSKEDNTDSASKTDNETAASKTDDITESPKTDQTEKASTGKKQTISSGTEKKTDQSDAESDAGQVSDTPSANSEEDTVPSDSGEQTTDSSDNSMKIPEIFRAFFSAAMQETDADLSNLEEEIASAKKISTEHYTTESVALFKAAISLAEDMVSDSRTSQEEAEKAAELLKKVTAALVEKDSDASVLEKAKSGKYDGLYTVEGKLWHATSANQASMGNDAVVKPIQVRIQNGVPTLRIEFVPLASKLGTINFTGYLGHLWYFPGYYGTTVPAKQTPQLCPVEEYYDVVDAYNDVSTGSDPNMKGKKYPHYVTMPVIWNCDTYFVQVYVSVMEAISSGSGTQYAKLAIDWNTITQIEGAATDKSKLQSAANLCTSFQSALTAGKVSEEYTALQQYLLNTACKAGYTLASDLNSSQAEIDAMTAALTAVKDVLNIREAADKTNLNAALTDAASYLKQTSVYTADSLTNLQNVYNTAMKVYGDYVSTQSEVDAQTQKIRTAISALAKKTSSAAASGTTAAKNTTAGSKTNEKEKSSSKSKTTKTGKKVSIKNLADGTYTITGKMVKIDKKTLSMSNDAINHTMKLTVKKSVYYITMDFNGLDINGTTGYLGSLKYFKSGYKLDSNGSPTGSLGAVTIDSYQKDSSGNIFKDALGSNYPDEVTFPLIKEAIKDGYVPLQVFVPVMESISAGTGTQPVFLKLDIDNVRTGYKKTSDSSKGTSGSSGTGKASNSGSTLTGGGTLGKSTLGNGTPGNGTLGNSLTQDAADSSTQEPEAALSVGTLTASTDGILSNNDGQTESDSAFTAAQADATDTLSQEPPLRKYVMPTGLGVLALALIESVNKARKMGMIHIFGMGKWIKFIK